MKMQFWQGEDRLISEAGESILQREIGIGCYINEPDFSQNDSWNAHERQLKMTRFVF